MADGINYNKTEVSKPSEKIAPGDQFGRIRVAYDEVTLSAELGAGEQIRFMAIPEGARIHDAVLSCDQALGGTCDLELGHLASDDGSISADNDALVDLVDCNGAAGFSKMSNGINGSPTQPVPGLMQEFASQTRVAATTTAASASATGATIKAAIYYSLD